MRTRRRQWSSTHADSQLLAASNQRVLHLNPPPPHVSSPSLASPLASAARSTAISKIVTVSASAGDMMLYYRFNCQTWKGLENLDHEDVLVLEARLLLLRWRGSGHCRSGGPAPLEEPPGQVVEAVAVALAVLQEEHLRGCGCTGRESMRRTGKGSITFSTARAC